MRTITSIVKLNTVLLFICLFLTGCGFHLQGEANLAPPLQRMYLQASDPYGYLARILKQNLRMSHVEIVNSPAEARTTLVIMQDNVSQDLFSVSGTQQTRQYILRVTVIFEVIDSYGRILLAPQPLTAARTITVQSNQILGSSNEMSLFYQQMRREIANAIIYRLASNEVTERITSAFQTEPPKKPL